MHIHAANFRKRFIFRGFLLLLLFFMHLISQVLLKKQSGPNGRINWKHRSVRRWDYGVLSLLVRFPLILVSFSSKSFTDSIIQRENYTSRSLGPICDKCSSEDKKKNTSQLCPEIENYWSELFKRIIWSHRCWADLYVIIWESLWAELNSKFPLNT